MPNAWASRVSEMKFLYSPNFHISMVSICGTSQGFFPDRFRMEGIVRPLMIIRRQSQGKSNSLPLCAQRCRLPSADQRCSITQNSDSRVFSSSPEKDLRDIFFWVPEPEMMPQLIQMIFPNSE